MRPYRLSMVASDDPYPSYRAFRDRDPAHYSPPEDVWVLTRYKDVEDAFRDWRTWSSGRRGNLLNDMPERIGRTLGTTDPPDHRFARGLVEKTFTRRTVERLSAKIDGLAAKLAGEARERRRIEMVRDISAPFNASILGAMFGLPEQDFLRLRRWLDDFFLREEGAVGEETPQARAMRNLSRYLDSVAGDRLERPSDDLMSMMLRADAGGRKLSREQVVITTMTFLTAGFESTNNLFTNLAHALALHQAVYRRVRRRPELVPDFVEEGMRWDAAAQGFVRCPTRDVDMHDKTIPAGAQVLLHIGSANRDERVFPDPDRLEIDRQRKRHLGFGKGIHFCVGAPLARLMAQSLFERLLGASRVWEVDLDGASRVETPNFRGFSVLPLRIREG
ncbi:MAG: cytochrome P450 [Bryobacterales bacterium]|nr:cytochrome P450 [Bryobacterales bacterium]